MVETFNSTFAIEDWNVISGQPSVGLNTDKKWTSSSSCNAFIGKQFAFETQCKCPFLKEFIVINNMHSLKLS
jgi:hypothetical protein